jgi:NAD-dependent SIR2 family protein deacetylase
MDSQKANRWRKDNAKGGRLDPNGMFYYDENKVDELLATHSAQVEAELVEAKEAEKQMVCSYCGTVSVSDGTREDKVRMAFEHIEKCEKSPAKQMLDAMVRAEAAEAELVKLREQIVIRQKVIHFGQFHQWATYAICREKGCADTRKLVGEALGETVPETPSTTSRET